MRQRVSGSGRWQPGRLRPDEGRVGFSEVLAGGRCPAGQPWGQGAAGADSESAASPHEGLLVSAGGGSPRVRRRASRGCVSGPLLAWGARARRLGDVPALEHMVSTGGLGRGARGSGGSGPSVLW